jgi:hypothetical protein
VARPNAGKLNVALKQVRNFVERLHAMPSSADLSDDGLTMFYSARLGGLGLSGNEAKAYKACLASLVALHGENADQRIISTDAVERVMRNAILRALRVRKPGTSRETFEARLTREIRRLRREILALPTEWLVTVRVEGLGPAGLPLRWGGIEFNPGTEALGNRLARGIVEFEPKRRAAARSMEGERKTRERAREEIRSVFSAGPSATLSVHVVDDKAAKHLAIERVRRAVDILNFFAPFFQKIPGPHRARVGPDGPRAGLTWIMSRDGSEDVHWSDGWADELPITEVDPTSTLASKFGLTRASEMFAQPEPSDLERRILNALGWAGRATVANRRDEQFLLFAIALEALLTKPTARVGVTDRLRLRAARLIGLLPETRKNVHALMSRIYERRSALVHAGDSTDLSEGDLKIVRELVRRALTGVLTAPHFVAMKTASDFEEWFEQQLFA